MIGRRAVLVGGALGLGAIAGSAEACSLTMVRNLPFDDHVCRRRIRDWVALLDRAPTMADAAIEAAAQAADIGPDAAIVTAVVGDLLPPSAERTVQFYKGFRLSAGRPDTHPIRISELNLLRRVQSRAVYRFTLDRYSYHPADDEGCNGMFVHDEYYGVDRTAYLATFNNNQPQGVRWFQEWPLERRA
jgi:hypothetical protein